MKKFLAILVVAGTLIACNDETTTDVKVSDTPATTPVIVDTPVTTVDTAGIKTDTSGKPADSLKK